MDFVELARFPSRLEAEAVGHALDQYGIPFLVQSADVGVFGPGMVGTSPIGARLLVPEDRLEEVQELLSCVAGSLENEILVEADPDQGPEGNSES